MSLTAALRAEYERLFSTCVIRGAWIAAVEAIISRILSNRQRYQAVEAATGVPWWFVAVIHSLEAGLRFDCHLHNGDPLTKRTTHVPVGHPILGSPPFTWQESALDALHLRHLNFCADWSVAGALYQFESYNGWGYRLHHSQVLSPYLWSFSNHYTSGKYIADGKFDPSAVSAQCGAAVLLKRLAERGDILLGLGSAGFSLPLDSATARSRDHNPGEGATQMSVLSKALQRIGVPKDVLDALQKVIDKGQADAGDIVRAWKDNLAGQIPDAAALADSIKRQPDFKRVYRSLNAAGQAAVEKALLTICECALVKLHKALGL